MRDPRTEDPTPANPAPGPTAPGTPSAEGEAEGEAPAAHRAEASEAPEATASPPPEAVTPLIRGIAVLHRLTEAGGTLSLSALERGTGLARATVDRITATLARMEYVRLDGRDVVLTPRVMEPGNAYLAALRLPTLLDARADALADELDESVSLAVADRDGVRFIHQATRRRAMSLSFRIGDLLPAERTAPGALFAADWTDAEWTRWHRRRAQDPEDRGFPAVPPREPAESRAAADDDDFVRRARRAAGDGWAVDDQLIEPGLVAVSVPVRDPGTGRIVCAANVVSHTSRHTAADLCRALLPRLREAVTAMEDDLRRAPEPAPGTPPQDLAVWTTASKHELGREFVESLARGLTVLTAFGEGRSRLTLTEVAKATGLARATARRALITYEHLGLVTSAPDRTFSLTPRVLSLGFPPLSRTTLPRLATPHLNDLAARLNESVCLASLTGRLSEEIQYTATATTSRVLAVNVSVGARHPARSTSLGRILLTDRPGSAFPELAAVRAQGYALVDEELESGVRTVAAPVHDRAGRTVAAVNVATHAARRTLEECVTEILPLLRDTATRIETDLHTASRFTRVPLT